MKRIIFAFTLLFAFPHLQAQPKNRPNVLFIAVDDLKPLLNSYGEAHMKTPNIDRLAHMGTVFLNNHCQQAVCAPTRASLLTGMRPDYTQVWDLQTQMRDKNPDILTLPQYFRQNGYVTTGLGKVFDSRSVDKMMDEPSWSVPFDRLSADDMAEGYGWPTGNYYQSPENIELLTQIRAKAKRMNLKGDELKAYLKANRGPAVESAEVPDDAYQDGAVARKAVATIARLAEANQPFFYAVGFVRPHLPFVAPKKYWDLYDRDEISLANYQQFAAESPKFAYQASGELVNTYLLTDGSHFQKGYAPQPVEIQKELIHGYYASVSYMDAQVGKLLDALDEQGLTKNTIVVLWGDHGWHLGDHGMWCKHTNFEQATRAPLIMAAPGFAGNQQAEGLTEFVDIFPTLTDLAGLKTPGHLAGKSLVPIMKNPKTTVKPFAQSQYRRSTKGHGKLMGYALRSARYRYVAWFAEDYDKNKILPSARPVAEELYDLGDDPNETVNFAARADHQKVLQQHQKYLTEFLGSQRQAR